MPELILLPTHQNNSGKINVIEKILPFKIKRVYWIFDISKDRGGHSHKITRQALVPIKGSCSILIKKKNFTKSFFIDKSNQLLILEPQDWHLIENCSKDLILLVLASEEYNSDDYVEEPVE